MTRMRRVPKIVAAISRLAALPVVDSWRRGRLQRRAATTIMPTTTRATCNTGDLRNVESDLPNDTAGRQATAIRLTQSKARLIPDIFMRSADVCSEYDF
jgi:hypothetical protein